LKAKFTDFFAREVGRGSGVLGRMQDESCMMVMVQHSYKLVLGCILFSSSPDVCNVWLVWSVYAEH